MQRHSRIGGGAQWLLLIAAALLGLLLIACASASATTFTSEPPNPPLAGEAYEVSVTSAAGGPVKINAQSACSFTRPAPGADQTPGEPERKHDQERVLPLSQTERDAPVTVYFVQAGLCLIEAPGAAAGEQGDTQLITVVKNPSEQIRFISTPPKDASVGGSYTPTVQSTAGLWVQFSSATPLVCEITEASDVAASHVNLIGAGTCTIDVRQDGSSPSEPAEAQQSFDVANVKKAPRQAIPAQVRAVLYDDVLARASSNRITELGEISLVATTLANADYGASSRPGRTPIYLVAWTGHENIDCEPPPGQTCGGPDAFELEYYAANLRFIEAWSGSSYRTPLDELGTPVQLAKPNTSRPIGGTPGTIVVHVYDMGVPNPQLPGCSEAKCLEQENEAVAVERLGPKGRIVSSFETAEHTIRVSPGQYRVGRGENQGERRKVTVTAGHVVEVTLYVPITD